MTRTLLLAAAIAMAAINTAVAEVDRSTAPRKTLTAFASEQELADHLKRWAEAAERRRKDAARASRDQAPAAAAAPAPAQALKEEKGADRSPTSSTPASTKAAS